MKQKTPFITTLLGAAALALFTMCGNSAPSQEQQQAEEPAAETQTPEMNTLTEAEKAEGWELLFDGNSLENWRKYGGESIGSSWKVQDGAIYLDAQKDPKGGWQTPDGGDITTDGVYGDFELQLEWKIDSCGNSGVIYRAVESDKYNYAWQTGPEMQVLDNACHPDAKIVKHRAGDFYDVVSSRPENVKPAGEWNSIRIIAKGNHVEHWQNGEKVVEVEMGTDEWKKLLKNSKWKDHPDFSTAKEGHIVLQDHGNKVWFRNIKIKKL